MWLTKILASAANKAALGSFLQLANPMIQTAIDFKACLSVKNTSQQVVRVQEGMMLHKVRELSPGEALEWHLLGTPAVMQLTIEERGSDGSFHRIAGCQKKLDFAHHHVEIKHVDGKTQNPLYCHFEH